MATITIDLDDSEVPVYRQIADGLRQRIASGALADGCELPGVRAMGRQLGVNLNTVAKAYRVLSDEGLIDLRQGAAARVCLGQRPAPVPAPAQQRRWLRELVGRLVLAGADRRSLERMFARTLDEFFGADGRAVRQR